MSQIESSSIPSPQPSDTGSYTGSPFYVSLVRGIRALDTYGAWEKYSDEEMLRKKFVRTKEELKKKQAGLDMDLAVAGNIRLMLQGIAAAFEKETGAMSSVLLDINHEAFGRGIILAGPIVVLERFYREAHRFGYPSIEKLVSEGDTLLEKAIRVYDQFKPCTGG